MIATETIKFFIHPFTIFWVFFLISALLYVFKRKKLFHFSLAVTLCWFIVISTSTVPMYLLKSLEDRHDPLINPSEMLDPGYEYHIVVLGAGYRNNGRYPETALLSARTLGRLVEGIRIHNQLPNSKIVTSGPHSFGIRSQAEVARDAAVSIGVKHDLILIQGEPETTFEEARIYNVKFYEGQKVIIVTDAAHMPRALYEFEKYVKDPIPAPANLTFNYKGMSFSELSIKPSYLNISYLNTAFSEYAAIFRNKIRDRK